MAAPHPVFEKNWRLKVPLAETGACGIGCAQMATCLAKVLGRPVSARTAPEFQKDFPTEVPPFPPPGSGLDRRLLQYGAEGPDRSTK